MKASTLAKLDAVVEALEELTEALKNEGNKSGGDPDDEGAGEVPRSSGKAGVARKALPAKGKKPAAADPDDEDDDPPAKPAKKARAVDPDDEDDDPPAKPKAKAKAKPADEDEDEDDDPPAKPAKKARAVDADDDDDDVPPPKKSAAKPAAKAKAKPAADEDEDEDEPKPKKGKKDTDPRDEIREMMVAYIDPKRKTFNADLKKAIQSALKKAGVAAVAELEDEDVPAFKKKVARLIEQYVDADETESEDPDEDE